MKARRAFSSGSDTPPDEYHSFLSFPLRWPGTPGQSNRLSRIISRLHELCDATTHRSPWILASLLVPGDRFDPPTVSRTSGDRGSVDSSLAYSRLYRLSIRREGKKRKERDTQRWAPRSVSNRFEFETKGFDRLECDSTGIESRSLWSLGEIRSSENHENI